MSLIVREVEIEGYRSIRKIRFSADRLTVFVGANGAGKTNLYRGLQLIQAAALGTLGRELAAEGGMASVMWAGPRARRAPPRLRFAVELDAGEDALSAARFAYEVEVGFPRPMAAAFPLEPQIKEELATSRFGRRNHDLLIRRGPAITVRDAQGETSTPVVDLMESETALATLRDGARYPDLETLRAILLDWRFYHDLRTDAASALRQPCLAVTAPTLDSDGGNLAAVFATLAHIRQDTADLDAAVADAFPGARLDVPVPQRMAQFGLAMPDFPSRVFTAAELSDGTLRYLALAGALLGYRLPAFVALNEPEASLHPDLLAPLARLIVTAAWRTQIWLVTHSTPLAEAIEALSGARARRVIKREGATALDEGWVAGDEEEE